jgi:hypothetical protein
MKLLQTPVFQAGIKHFTLPLLKQLHADRSLILPFPLTLTLLNQMLLENLITSVACLVVTT